MIIAYKICLQSTKPMRDPNIHTLLASPGSLNISRKSPLVIMDGPEALASYESINTSSTVVMLTHSEYENETRDILSMLGSYREESLLPDLDGVEDIYTTGFGNNAIRPARYGVVTCELF